MANIPVSLAIVRQLDAALQLVEAMSSSLSINDITEIRRGLARAFAVMGVIVQERNLETEGIIFARESRSCGFRFSTQLLQLQPTLISPSPGVTKITSNPLRPLRDHRQRMVLEAAVVSSPQERRFVTQTAVSPLGLPILTAVAHYPSPSSISPMMKVPSVGSLNLPMCVRS